MKLFPAFFLVPILLSAVLKVSGESPSLAEAIQPRTIDSKWNYSSYYFEGDQVFSGGTAQELVVEEREIEGVKIFRVRLLTDWRTFGERLSGVPLDPESTSYFWEYSTEEGSFNFDEDFDEPAPPSSLSDFSLTLPYPTEKGFVYEIDGSQYEVIAVDFEVTVPVGTFETVVYEITNDGDSLEGDRERFYMAPGVGLVRWEMDVRGEDGEWTLEYRDDLFGYTIDE